MAKIKITRKVFIFITFLFLILFSLACLKVRPADNLNINQSKPVNAVNLEQQYELSLKEILKPYWQNQEINGIKDKILDLRAPAKYLDLHFNLVIAFELIGQGQAVSNQAEIEEGLEKLLQLKAQYNWLN